MSVERLKLFRALTAGAAMFATRLWKIRRGANPVRGWCILVALVCLQVSALSLLLTVRAGAEPDWLRQAVARVGVVGADSGASWVVLHKVKTVEVSSNGRSESRVRFAAEIVRASAEPFAELRELVDSYREILDLKGWIVLPGGTVNDLDEDMIARAAARGGPREYSEDQILIATLPRMDVGSVVAFEYRIIEVGWPSFFQGFVFQYQQPVRLARFRLRLPRGWDYHKAERSMSGIEYRRNEDWHEWTGEDLRFRPQEPLSPPWTYLARRLIISAFDPGAVGPETEVLHVQGLFRDWDAVARWYANLTAEASRSEDIVKATSRRLVEGMTSPADKVAAVASFVQDLRYVAAEFGEGKWQPRCASVTLHNRYGDCKDKTVLMQAMLDAAGLSSAPVLASVTLPVDEDFPNPLQFNHVLVGVPVIGLGDLRVYSDAIAEGWLFFDSTGAEMALGGLPGALQGRTVLVCTSTGGHLISLPTISPARTYLREHRIDADLHDDGSVSADVTVIDRGYEAAYVSMLRACTPLEEQIESWKRRIYPNAPALAITNFQYVPDPDSGWVRFRVEMPGYATGIDSIALLKLDFLHPAVPPELTAGTRTHPVELGSRGITRSSIHWRLPPDWGQEIKGVAGTAVCEGGRLRYRLSPLAPGELRLQWEIEYTGVTMPPSDYSRALEFSREMSDLRSMTVLLRKKGDIK